MPEAEESPITLAACGSSANVARPGLSPKWTQQGEALLCSFDVSNRISEESDSRKGGCNIRVIRPDWCTGIFLPLGRLASKARVAAGTSLFPARPALLQAKQNEGAKKQRARKAIPLLQLSPQIFLPVHNFLSICQMTPAWSFAFIVPHCSRNSWRFEQDIKGWGFFWRGMSSIT